MASLNADFDDLIRRIEAGREFAHASFEPIFYLIFDPGDLLEVKRLTTSWISRLTNAGWQVETFSIAEHIADIWQHDTARKLWIAADRTSPLAWERTNGALRNALTTQDRLQLQLEERLTALEGKTSTILLVTDLEALHPYMRIGAIEAQLQGKFHVPTVFLYPGKRTGKTRLKFLGFYSEDGNYRSVHVGG